MARHGTAATKETPSPTSNGGAGRGRCVTMPFSSVHWDHEPSPSPSREGIAPQFPSWEGPGVGLSATGSWKAPTTFVPRIGTLHLTVRQNLFGVPPSGGPDRLKPGHQTVGSWKAPTTPMPCIGTMNLERERLGRQGAADVSSAEPFSDASAGKMPAAPSGSGEVVQLGRAMCRDGLAANIHNRFLPSALRQTLHSLLTAPFRRGMPTCIWCALCAAPLFTLADSVTLRPVADTGISTQSPTSNSGTGPDMVIGTQGPTVGMARNRGLIKFDLTGQIPAGAEIKSVTLTLTVAKVPSGGANSSFELRRLFREWKESEATWNNRIGGGTWSSPGAAAPADFSTTTSGTTLVSGLGGCTFGSTTNLIADVQTWVDNPATNFGWIVLTQSETVAKTARRITAHEGGPNGPALVVEYTPGQTQAQPPLISQLSLLGDAVRFEFSVESQRPYTVEFNNEMAATNWLTLTNIAAQPAPTNITVSDSTTASQRFYRVKTP